MTSATTPCTDVEDACDGTSAELIQEWVYLEDESLNKWRFERPMSLTVRRAVVAFVHSVLKAWHSPGVHFFEMIKVVDAARESFGDLLAPHEAILRAGALCLTARKLEVVRGQPVQ
eukprot:5714842-Amphidinium_carterae.1